MLILELNLTIGLIMIILLGFPKSGTTSFHELFNSIGMKSYHWTLKQGVYIGTLIKRNKEQKRELLSFLESKENVAITQMDICISKNDAYWPQIIDYEQLYNENKDAIFILNKRDPESLLMSLKKWQSYDQRMFQYSSELFRGIEGATNDEKIVNLIERHYSAIEEFFQSNGSKFVIYDINNDDITKLEKYVNLKNVKAFPHVNKNKKN